MFDCGPLGEGNHGHLDCLSFELAAHGRSLVVDPGRYTYSEAGETNWRVHFRGTAAHNTVCVDGRNQTRYEPKPVKDKSRHAEGSVRLTRARLEGGIAPRSDLTQAQQILATAQATSSGVAPPGPMRPTMAEAFWSPLAMARQASWNASHAP